VGDGAADRAGESESGIEVEAGGSGGVDLGRDSGLCGIELGRAGAGGGRRSRHVADRGDGAKSGRWRGEVWWSGWVGRR